jgi:NADPH-dependent 2,4-dienoyl-CoA reductase/sulfur reductase-like enzyme/nitrite reductase/ring-hydroxylating ferredoxin subunit
MDAAEKADFCAGIPASRLADGGMLQGTVGGEDVVLARRGDEFFAVGASCTHYGGPLAKGLVTGDEVRCPLHHACFSLRTGEALRAPAFDPLPCWRVERQGDRVVVREKLSPTPPPPLPSPGGKTPSSVVIVGGGAAGLAAAEKLRREGYPGSLTLISADDQAPYDRPNLSKEFLSGHAPEEWIPLRSPEFYASHRIELVLGSPVTSIDPRAKQVRTSKGTTPFEALLLATGADPIRLPVPGAPESQVFTLRSFADSRAIVAKAASGKKVVVVGGSFIGLETAASLRERGLVVHVVAPEAVPLERVFGAEVGRFVQGLHTAHGVEFHLGETVAAFDGREATLSGGPKLEADFLVLGVGVRPSLALAEQAGLALDRGVRVDPYLETSVPGIYAAGDIARWPDLHTGQAIRIEHWAVAERQGQVAAENILGRKRRFDAVPFFWTRQHGVSIKYVGHAEKWDRIAIEGSLEQADCVVTYSLGGRTLAVATIGRDRECLEAEVRMEASALA